MAGYINNYRKKYGNDYETALKEDVYEISNALKEYKKEMIRFMDEIRSLNRDSNRPFKDERVSFFDPEVNLPATSGGLSYCSPFVVDRDEETKKYHLIDFNNQLVVDQSDDPDSFTKNHPEKLIVNTGGFSLLPILENKEKGYLVMSHMNRLRKGKYGFKMDTFDDYFHYSTMIYDHFNGVGAILIQAPHDPDIMLKLDDRSAQIGFHYSSFIETIYGLEKTSIDNSLHLDEYFKLLKYSENNYQSFLQTKQYSNWFLNNVIQTMRSGGKPMNEKNIQSWLGLNLPDMKFLLSQPNQNMLIHFLITNKHKETSLAEFLKTEDKIIELNEKWLKDFDKRHLGKPRYEYVSARDHIILTRKNKYIMSTNSLPEFMKYYNDQKIFKDHSLYRYLKYIIDEGKRSFNKETKTFLSLKDIENYLDDYNRMLKQINPQAKYVMPYNVKKAHDSMVENHLQIMDERRQIGNGDKSYFINFMSVYKEQFYRAEEGSNYTVVHPTKSYDLHEEGSELNHCVASYADKVLSGKSLIYFMRRRSDPQKPLITIEIYKDSTRDSYYINQSRGKGNRLPNPEEKHFLEQWINVYNERYKLDKKQKQKEAEQKRLEAQEFNQDFVNTLKLYGFKDIRYDSSLDKNSNYIQLAQKGISYIIQKQKSEDIYDSQSIDGLIENITKIFKKEKVKINTMESLLEYIPIENKIKDNTQSDQPLIQER